jgi:hypothetical protein
MEVNINTEELRKRKLMLLVPMYGGQCYSTFTIGLASLISKMRELGVHFEVRFQTNESLVQRARNYLADQFMESECTHAIFIDADIGFDPDHVMIMLALMSDESDYDVMCGLYPKKNISWEKVKQAVDKGAADENPDELQHYIGDYVLSVHQGQTEVSLHEPFRVREAGTGFMMIKRSTFEAVRDATPEMSYRPDHPRTNSFDGRDEIHAYFHCIIEPETKRYLSEDYYFCRQVEKAGKQIWAVPAIVLTHTGTYTFAGSLAHLASIGADPTAMAYTALKRERLAKQAKQKLGLNN